ncbi:GNAT family N-acetyltransferase [Paenibacillus sp. KN14-4R]|uniref:GNAT family N-acetyltransferase n=1 Tax=Paenibacillus sp. KN14-4R TaxID=3445773 RepID=UPI003FA0783B
MKTQIINAELTYTKLFSQSYEEENLIRFWDDEIPDMYTHNFTLVKNYSENLMEIISDELTLRKEQNKSFLRIEMNFDINEKILGELHVKPELTIYDYMYIKTDRFRNIGGNSDCVIKQASSDEVILDGRTIDVLANEDSMGQDFARRRIDRKLKVYEMNQPLDLYVCYHKDIPIGNCELMTLENIAKIEDFDILKEYQRRGFGSKVIKYLLQRAEKQNVKHAYLITDSSDTAKEMYKKCGFEKIGVKTELQFQL